MGCDRPKHTEQQLGLTETTTHQPLFALVDIDHLILDVDALVVSVCRQHAEIKVSTGLVAHCFDGIDFVTAVHSILAILSPSSSRSTKDSSTVLPPGIIEKLLLYASLIRPCFDAPALLRFIASELRLHVVFVTSNVKLVIPAIRRPQQSCSDNESTMPSIIDFCDPLWTPTKCNNSAIPIIPDDEWDPSVADRLSCEPSLPPDIKVTRILPEGSDAERHLYFVGADKVLDSLPPLDELLTSHALFFKSRRLLSTLINASKLSPSQVLCKATILTCVQACQD